MKRLTLVGIVVILVSVGALQFTGAATATANPDAAASPPPAAVFTAVDVPGTTALAAAPESLLAKYGYVEQEYYVSGNACRYQIADPLADAQVVDCGWPYTTRMLVRRPANPDQFNGTATVEWNNVSTGQDIDFVWAATHEYQMRHGYASISVSAQLNGLNPLKAWSPARYGSLSLDAPNTDPSTGGILDATGDVLSWDVLSQTIAGIRQPAGVDPLRGIDVKYVVANGESQSALRLTTYYNAVDPLHHMVDGVVFYDAAGLLRTDSQTKAISVATEIGVGLLPTGYPAADSANYRRWEVAGTSHVSYQDMEYVDPIVLRDGLLRTPEGEASTLSGITTGCAWYPLWSTVPTGYVLDAAFDQLGNWIKSGRAAATVSRMERDPDAPPIFDPAAGGTAPAYAKNADGTTIGGIQLAEYAYRTAEIEGAGNTGPGSCWLAGKHRFFTESEIDAQYPSPRTYLWDVTKLTAQNVRAGVLLREDAARTLVTAYLTIR